MAKKATSKTKSIAQPASLESAKKKKPPSPSTTLENQKKDNKDDKKDHKKDKKQKDTPHHTDTITIVDPNVLSQTSNLPTFLQTIGTLTISDRRLLVEQALVLLEQFYVHLPLKQKMHAIQPLQRLKLLQHQLAQTAPEALPNELLFHNEMTSIFVSLRDLHTNYMLPEPFNQHTAFLPFLVEEYFVEGQPRYLVSKVTTWLEHPTFRPGVEVKYWNGVPIARAVQLNADRQAGSNLEARRARGIEALTIRPLFISLPPDEEWVVIGYETPDGQSLEVRQDWLISSYWSIESWLPRDPSAAHVTHQGNDIQTQAVQETKKTLFVPQIAAEERQARSQSDTMSPTAPPPQGLDTNLPWIMRASTIDRAGKTYGYLRIFTFNIEPETFIPEVTRLLAQMPPDGLILDVRGNGGGYILSGEELLQLLTPQRIEPERLELINTPYTLELVRQNIWLSDWEPSIAQSVSTGAIYSNGFPITPPESANAIGQKYCGPVLLITDALCYSTTDIFAAGFQDHGIGMILGVSGNTGAGGANVWDHGLLLDFLQTSPITPMKPLPNGAGMRVSIRRTLRVGQRMGTPVEDLGIVPDYRHYLTKNDLLNGNVDLIDRAISLLAELPLYRLKLVSRQQTATTLTLEVDTLNVPRIDIYLDGRPQTSIDSRDGVNSIAMPLPEHPVYQLELRGFEFDRLVAVQRIALVEAVEGGVG